MAVAQASLTAAVRNINAHNKTVAVEVVGYLLEELRDAANFNALKEDVASANIFVGSLIFIEELADKAGSLSIASTTPVSLLMSGRDPASVHTASVANRYQGRED